jgi:hypothetical protein
LRAAIQAGLEEPPLLLHVASPKGKTFAFKAKRKFEPSSVFPGYWEHTVVTMDECFDPSYTCIATNVYISRQHPASVDGMRGISAAEQAGYNNKILANLGKHGLHCTEPN